MHRDWRLFLLILLTSLGISLAYQVRMPVEVDVGALGDRAYLWASPLGERRFGFNGDERLMEERISYRWTKWVSWINFPDLGWDGPFLLSLRLRSGRSASTPDTFPGSAPPRVEVRANGVLVGSFPAPAEWEMREFPVGEFPGQPPNLQVSIECTPTFSLGKDPRTLGVQLDRVRLTPRPLGLVPTLPPWRQVLLWTAGIVWLYLALRRYLGRWAFRLGLILVAIVSLGLALARLCTPYAPTACYAALALFLLLHADYLWRGLRQLLRRARSLPFYVLLSAGLLLVTGAYIRGAIEIVPGLGPRLDAIMLIVFLTSAILYALLTWFEPLKSLLARFDALLRGRWLPALLLVLLLTGLTAYELAFIREMQFIGHADYADNAVVARNLLAGRGFTVDYVAQFYRVYPAISHPQETWPLLQPMLIAPFFHFLGDSPFAAKLPNLLLQLALVLALYILGSRFFDDRRAGLMAALLTVFNRYTFRLVIFPTSDLAFTLFALLTLGQFFWATEREKEGRSFFLSYLWAGVWAGWMMLSKPNGALFVAVALLWDLLRRWRGRRWAGWWKAWLAFLLPAGLLFAPWVFRNLFLFGSPVYSTEQFDAWILKYQDWEEIYRIYFRDLPERSWLLRYGFDRVFEAIGLEFRRWWLYFSRDAGSLLTLLGSFLALGGALALRGRAARLFALVGAVFFLFGAFICIYWHVEERYFVPFIPWLALLVARALWWGHDTLAYWRDEEGRRSSTGFGWLGLLLLVLACLHLTASFSREAAAKMEMDRGPAVRERQVWDASRGQWVVERGPPQGKRAEIQAYRWLAEHSAPDAVVMTRVPWQFTYYSGRRSVMIPQGSLEEVRCIAELYGVDYLLMEGDGRTERPTLQQALQSGGGPWTLLYDEGGVQVYAFSSRFQEQGLGRLFAFLRDECGQMLLGKRR